LLLQAEGIVAAAVERVAVDAAEVADTGKRYVEQAVQELPHTVAAQGNLDADRHALTELEVRNRLAGVGDNRLLAGNHGDIADNGLDNLGVAVGLLAAADVDNDLVNRRDLHRALVLELLHQSRRNIRSILGF